MFCPKCGREASESIAICDGCDFIWDTSFLGEGFIDREHDLRVRRAEFSGAAEEERGDYGADALILGDLADEVGSFQTADTGLVQREVTHARIYVGGTVQQMLEPDSIPACIPGIEPGALRLTPFERHILELVDGKRPIARIKRKSGLEDDDLRTALATLTDKGYLQVVGKARRRSQGGAMIPLAEYTTVATSPLQGVSQPVGERPDGGGSAASERTVVMAVRPSDIHSEVTQLEEVGASEGARSSLSRESQALDYVDSLLSQAPFTEVSRAPVDPAARYRPRPMSGRRRRPPLPGEALDATAATPALTPSPPQNELTPAPSDARDPRASAVDESHGVFAPAAEAASEFVHADTQEYLSQISTGLPAEPPHVDDDSALGDVPRVDGGLGFLARQEESSGRVEEGDSCPPPTTGAHPRGAAWPQTPSQERTRIVEVPEGVPPSSFDIPWSVSSSDVLPLSESAQEDAARATSGTHESPRTQEGKPPKFSEKSRVAARMNTRTGGPELDGIDISLRSLDAAEAGSVSEPPTLEIWGARASPTASAASHPNFTVPSAPPPGLHAPSLDDEDVVHDSEEGAPVSSNEVTFELRRKATKIFEEAERDMAEGRRSSAIMNAKLAMIHNPHEPQYRRMLELWSSQPAVVNTRRSAVVELLERAQDAETRGDYSESAALLSQAIEQDPHAPALYNRLGVLLATRLQRYKDASEQVLRAIELNPKSLTYKNNLGKILAREENALARQKQKRRDIGQLPNEAVLIKPLRPKPF